MNHYWRFCCLLAALLLFLPQAQAGGIDALQGDVIELQLTHHADAPELQCFGKRWPVLPAGTDRWHGWVGIDMKTPPGDYRCHWHYGKADTPVTLHVQPGHFRISRITVKKSMAEFDTETLARIRREVKELKATYRMHVDASPVVAMPQMPVEGIESTPFGAQRYVNGEPRSPHTGIDIAAAEGTPVRAPLGGRVLYVASMYLNGNTVVIGHGHGLVSVLSHLAKARVHTGDTVQTGDIIGEVGQTGRATGPHLHWSIRFQEARVNPHSLLPPAKAGDAAHDQHLGMP